MILIIYMVCSIIRYTSLHPINNIYVSISEAPLHRRPTPPNPKVSGEAKQSIFSSQLRSPSPPFTVSAHEYSSSSGGTLCYVVCFNLFLIGGVPVAFRSRSSSLLSLSVYARSWHFLEIQLRFDWCFCCFVLYLDRALVCLLDSPSYAKV